MINRGRERGCGTNTFLMVQKVLLVDNIKSEFSISKQSCLIPTTHQPLSLCMWISFSAQVREQRSLRGACCIYCGVPGVGFSDCEAFLTPSCGASELPALGENLSGTSDDS